MHSTHDMWWRRVAVAVDLFLEPEMWATVTTACEMSQVSGMRSPLATGSGNSFQAVIMEAEELFILLLPSSYSLSSPATPWRTPLLSSSFPLLPPEFSGGSPTT